MLVLKSEWINRNPFVVFLLLDSSGTPQYIGTSRYAGLLSAGGARANSFFPKIFPEGSTITIHILFTSIEKYECQNYVHEWLSKNPRPFMMRKGVRLSRTKAVICNETGDVYESVSEAARAFKSSISAMSNHLYRRPGYLHVRGYTFNWNLPIE